MPYLEVEHTVTGDVRVLAAAEPPWTDVAGAVTGALTLLAIIVGATVGYVRFARSRKMHGRCSLVIEASLARINGCDRALRVAITVTNDGTYRLVFKAATYQVLQVASASEQMITEARNGNGVVAWHEGIFHQQDIFDPWPKKKKDDALGAGQSLGRCILVRRPDENVAAYRVQVGVEAYPRLIWKMKEATRSSAESVVPCEVADERS